MPRVLYDDGTTATVVNDQGQVARVPSAVARSAGLQAPDLIGAAAGGMKLPGDQASVPAVDTQPGLQPTPQQQSFQDAVPLSPPGQDPSVAQAAAPSGLPAQTGNPLYQVARGVDSFLDAGRQVGGAVGSAMERADQRLAAAKPVASPSGGGGGGLGGSQKGVLDAMANVGTAEGRAAETHAQGIDDQIAAAQEGQKQIDAQDALFQQHEQLRQQKMAEGTQAYQQAMDDFKNTSVDPDRWFKSKSTLAQVGLGISLLLGGVAQGLTRSQTNPAYEAIQQNINRDIDAQKTELEKKKEGVDLQRNLFAMNMQRFGDERSAELATRAQMLEGLNSKLRISAMQTDSADVRARAAVVIARNNAEIAKTRYGFDQANAARAAASAHAGMGMLIKDPSGRPIGIAATPEAAKKATEEMLKHDEAWRNANDPKLPESARKKALLKDLGAEVPDKELGDVTLDDIKDRWQRQTWGRMQSYGQLPYGNPWAAPTGLRPGEVLRPGQPPATPPQPKTNGDVANMETTDPAQYMQQRMRFK